MNFDLSRRGCVFIKLLPDFRRLLESPARNERGINCKSGLFMINKTLASERPESREFDEKMAHSVVFG